MKNIFILIGHTLPDVTVVIQVWLHCGFNDPVRDRKIATHVLQTTQQYVQQLKEQYPNAVVPMTCWKKCPLLSIILNIQ